ncbi:xanthine dehydrogenase family protein molybdopterin-binding subunit [Brevibacillus agri]|uniref:xanthine dehydrogenase family protein molybdopterin-binding subunit n=1 Tax=Brevibacillus agri TaxID=51101 RepID=UPI002E23240D|nr:xanthine dehydrogenase family protein molybdopterin-binding subunit [Brevibacillus agri]MED1657208.1 xanthine dehydrogenase family protein molybdopterin-binding subunit [Brevibacillus agri]MED1689627.1 xanthine dehydrogenase family protein molybdopterin-binding subunit [Brevibacillus agri]MED1693913.1 xanthine dehydrogenase family protein molybdopterin-binding subunit [Brevibacillus agri]MED1698289.1 xanthine dehydrogenase family protein molybdopterin-binding subunit [Brevibacillus agri]
MNQHRIGEPMSRVEDARLTSGQGSYIEDMNPLPNIHHVAILRSPYPHARIKSIRTEKAEQMPGVKGVVTGKDVAELTSPFPVGVTAPVNYYSMAVDKVRFVGEPVAVVVAKNRYLAEDALDQIEVEYEPLPSVVDIEKALLPDSPILHENVGSNIANHRTFSYGNTEKAFREADHVVKHKFLFPKYSATPVETYGVIAHYQSSGDNLTIWSNFHGPFTLHSVMAAALRMNSNQLRIMIPKDVGGSYGIKSGVYPYMVLMGAVSKKVGLPVKWIEDRQEHLMASSSGTDRVTWIEAAVKNDGTVTGLRMKMVDNVGAYIRAPEPASLYRNHSNSTGPYQIKHLDIEAIAVMTNKSPTGLIRGYGGQQMYFPLERIMHMVATKLGMDPADVIRKNLINKEEFPYRTPSGGIYDSGDYVTAFEKALKTVNYEEFRKRQAQARQEGRYLGIGLACIVEPSGSNMGYITVALTPEERAKSLPKSGNAEGATVSIDPMGGISVRISTAPTGQGHETVAAQIVGEVLGVDPRTVRVIAEIDTLTSPWSVASGSYSSRFAPLGSSAVYQAAGKVRSKLLHIAAAQLGHSPDELIMEAGKVAVQGDPTKQVSLKRLVGSAHWNPQGLPAGTEPGIHETAFYAIPTAAPPDENDQINGSATYGFVADAVTVEVDPETGDVKILDYITVHDAGKLLNPLIADGQIMGGLAHGLGGALYEELAYDKNGQFLTGSFMDYLCPTATEIPPVTIEHIETPSPLTPLGAKGLGEGNTMSAPAVIANAVEDALSPLAVTIDTLPLSPNRIWSWIQQAKTQETSKEEELV